MTYTIFLADKLPSHGEQLVRAGAFLQRHSKIRFVKRSGKEYAVTNVSSIDPPPFLVWFLGAGRQFCSSESSQSVKVLIKVTLTAPPYHILWARTHRRRAGSDQTTNPHPEN